MTETALRKELHAIIDVMPDQFIQAMMPLVACIAKEHWKPAIEPADADEIAMVEEAIRECENDPSAATPWRKVRRSAV